MLHWLLHCQVAGRNWDGVPSARAAGRQQQRDRRAAETLRSLDAASRVTRSHRKWIAVAAAEYRASCSPAVAGMRRQQADDTADVDRRSVAADGPRRQRQLPQRASRQRRSAGQA